MYCEHACTHTQLASQTCAIGTHQAGAPSHPAAPKGQPARLQCAQLLPPLRPPDLQSLSVPARVPHSSMSWAMRTSIALRCRSLSAETRHASGEVKSMPEWTQGTGGWPGVMCTSCIVPGRNMGTCLLTFRPPQQLQGCEPQS